METLIVLTVYILIPLTGLLIYFRLTRQLKTENIQNAPIGELFLIFANYGGLLLLTLASLIWPLAWSGMASIGTFYLVFGAPLVMGIVSFRHRRTKTISKYHKWTYYSGLLYFVIAPVTIFALVMTIKN